MRTRVAVEYTGFPLHEKLLRDQSAHFRLSFQLSTRSGSSTRRTLAREYALASENLEGIELIEVEKGQCGTVFAIVGTDEAI